MTLTRRDLMALIEEEADDVTRSRPRDLTGEEVGEEMQRSPSAVRRWLISGDLRGYKLMAGPPLCPGRLPRTDRPASFPTICRTMAVREARGDV